MANRKSPSRNFPAAAAVSAAILITVFVQAKPRCELPETGLPELEKAERLCQAARPDSRSSRCRDFLSELAAVEEPSLDQALALAFGPVMDVPLWDLEEDFEGAILAGREVLKPFVDAAPDDPMLLKTYAAFFEGAHHRFEILVGGGGGDDVEFEMYADLLRRVLALDPACGSAAHLLAGIAAEADDDGDFNRYMTHGYEHSEGMWKLLFAFEKYMSLDSGTEADAFRAQVAADVGSRHMLVEADSDAAFDLEKAFMHQLPVLDRTLGFLIGLVWAEVPHDEHNGPAEEEYLTAGYEHSPGTWELLVVLSTYESLRDDQPGEAEAYRAQIAAEFESRTMPLDAANRAESLNLLCNGSALKLRMEARCESAVQEVVASDRLANAPLGADVLKAIDSLNGAAERGDFGDDGGRRHEHLRQLLEAEPEDHRSAGFYVVYSRVLRPTAGVEAEADALRRALDLDPYSGEIGLYLNGALKRLGQPTQEIEAVYHHVVANADERSAKDGLGHYAAKATRLLEELPSQGEVE